jgi:hypothetical protein
MDWEKDKPLRLGIFAKNAGAVFLFPVHSQISSFEFEMQDSSNFKISRKGRLNPTALEVFECAHQTRSCHHEY